MSTKPDIGTQASKMDGFGQGELSASRKISSFDIVELHQQKSIRIGIPQLRRGGELLNRDEGILQLEVAGTALDDSETSQDEEDPHLDGLVVEIYKTWEKSCCIGEEWSDCLMAYQLRLSKTSFANLSERKKIADEWDRQLGENPTFAKKWKTRVKRFMQQLIYDTPSIVNRVALTCIDIEEQLVDYFQVDPTLGSNLKRWMRFYNWVIQKDEVEHSHEFRRTPLMYYSGEGDVHMVKKFLLLGADITILDERGLNCLHLAASRGHIEVVRAVLNIDQSNTGVRGSGRFKPIRLDVDAVDARMWKRTALHYAAANNHEEVVDELLRHHADVNLQDSHGRTPLMKAIEGKNARIMHNLLDHGADVSIADELGLNSLHLAASDGQVETVRALLNPSRIALGALIQDSELPYTGWFGASKVLAFDVDVVDANPYWQRTALYYAAAGNHEGVVRELLHHRADPRILSKEGLNGLHVAASKGHVEVVRVLLGWNQSTTDHDRWSAHGEHLLVNSVTSCSLRWTVLHHAVEKNCLDVLKELLGRQPALEVKDGIGRTPLMLCCHSQRKLRGSDVRVTCAEELVRHGANPFITNQRGWNCLHIAASKGNEELVKALLGKTLDSADVDVELVENLVDSRTQDDDGRSALMIFCEEFSERNVLVAEVLLQHGADPFLTNKEGLNCLHVAAAKGHVELVKVLLKHFAGTDSTEESSNMEDNETESRVRTDQLKQLVNCTDSGQLKRTALQHAAANNHREVLEALLADGLVNIDYQDAEGSTTLKIAASGGYKKMVKILLDSESEVLLCDSRGISCLHVAAFAGHAEVVKLLVKVSFDPAQILDDILDIVVKIQLMDLKSKCEELTAVHMAAMGHHFDIAFFLLDRYRVLKQRSCNVQRDPLMMLAWSNVLAEEATRSKTSFDLDQFQNFNEEDLDPEMHTKWKAAYENAEREFLGPMKRILVAHSTLDSKEKEELRIKLKDCWNPLCNRSPGFQAHQLELKKDDSEGFKAGPMHWGYFRMTRWVDVYVDVIAYTNTKDSRGRSALHYAAAVCQCEPGREKYVNCLTSLEKLLAMHAANLNLSDFSGHTPLHLALKRWNSGVIQTVLKVQCPPEEKSLRFTRASKRSTVSIKVDPRDTPTETDLLRTTSELSLLQDSLWDDALDGATPLHYACHHQIDMAIVERLVEANKVDLIARTKDGVAPITIPLSRCPVLYSFRTHEDSLSHDNLLCPPFRDESRSIGLGEPDKNHKTWERLEELAILAENYGEPGEDQIQIWTALLWSMRELIGRRRLSDMDKMTMLEGMKEDKYHWEGLSLLHYAAFRGRADVMEKLLQVPQLKTIVNMPYSANGQTPLHFAVNEGHIEVVEMLARSKLVRMNEEDSSNRTAYELVLEIMDPSTPSSLKDVEAYLMDQPDVQRYIEKQYRDRQIHVDAGNTALVGAALIASVTFAGWLQPPLGYTAYSEFKFSDSEANRQYAAVKQYMSVQVFVVLNSLSFLFAVATVVCGARAVLPAPTDCFIAKEVRLIRRWLIRTSVLLVLSIIGVLGAFTAAGFAVLPPTMKYQVSMILTTIVGGLTCIVVLVNYFHRLNEIRVWVNIKRWTWGRKNDSSRYEYIWGGQVLNDARNLKKMNGYGLKPPENEGMSPWSSYRRWSRRSSFQRRKKLLDTVEDKTQQPRQRYDYCKLA